MNNKNPLFLNIDLTSSSKSLFPAQSNQQLKPHHKPTKSQTITPSTTLQIQSPSFQMNAKYSPNSKLTQNQSVQINHIHQSTSHSRITHSSQSPHSVLKTEPSPDLKSFVKSSKTTTYYRLDPNKFPQYSSTKCIKIHFFSFYSESQQPSSQQSQSQQKVKIYVRIKPSQAYQKPILKQVGQNQLYVNNSDDNLRPFEFYRIFDNASQNEVYTASSAQIVEEAAMGISSGVVLTYGQTGSGKTYTMGLLDSIQSADQGIVSMGLTHLFQTIKEHQIECKVELSFIQIYLEEVNDLLNPDSGPLQIRELKDSHQPYVSGMVSVEIESVEQGFQLIDAGIRHRVVAAQVMNKNSSRSHTILMLTVKQLRSNKLTKITFLDLAGSERIKKSQSKGLRMDEAKSINTSLSALGNVIVALGQPNQQHIPYRDSKLTRILQAYLTGDSQVALICTITKTEDSVNETLSTLMFAQRCKDVQLRSSKPIPAQAYQTEDLRTEQHHESQFNGQQQYEVKIRELEKQIKELQNSVEYQKKKSLEDSSKLMVVQYLLKMFFKIKQYTQTQINEALQTQQIVNPKQLDNQIRQLPYKDVQIQRVQELIKLVETKYQNTLRTSIVKDMDVEKTMQMESDDMLEHIQGVGRQLLEDINSLVVNCKSAAQMKSELVFNQLEKEFHGKVNEMWLSMVAQLVHVSRQQMKQRLESEYKQMLDQTKLTIILDEYQNKLQQRIFRFDLYQNEYPIKKQLEEKMFQIKSNDETRIMNTLNILRKYTNNLPIKDIGHNKTNPILDNLLKKHSTKLAQANRFSFVNNQQSDPPPIYHSPQDVTNVSALLQQKKQQLQSNPFNDISSLDNENDQSDRFENSKFNNILDLSNNQIASNHLSQVIEVEEPDYNTGKNKEDKEKAALLVGDINNQSLEPRQRSHTPVRSNDQSDKLKLHLSVLQQQITKSQNQSQDKVAKSTIQEIAKQSRTNSIEYTNKNSLDQSIQEDSMTSSPMKKVPYLFINIF